MTYQDKPPITFENLNKDLPARRVMEKVGDALEITEDKSDLVEETLREIATLPDRELTEIRDGTLRRMEEGDLIRGVDPFPFASLVWNSVDAMLRWGPILERCRSLHDRAEYWMVLEGKRKCATLHISPRNYDKLMEQIQSDGLVWLPIQRTRNYNGFSHRHYPVEELDQNSSVYGVLARTKEDAEAFRAASIDGRVNHKIIGELLGFPECCAEFFVEIWPTFYDPVYQAAERSPHRVWQGENYSALYVTPHIATHQMLRYVGFRLTSHLPCCLHCEKSVKVARDWLDVCRKYDPQGTECLLEILSLPGEWSVCHGIAVVETPYFTVVSNSMPTKGKWAVRWDSVSKEGLE